MPRVKVRKRENSKKPAKPPGYILFLQYSGFGKKRGSLRGAFAVKADRQHVLARVGRSAARTGRKRRINMPPAETLSLR